MRKFSRKYCLKQVVSGWMAFLMLMLSPVQVALATPSGGNVTGGIADINQSGNTTTVNVGSGLTSINWNSLDTSQQEILQFLSGQANFVALNRVIQGGATQFDGSLFGNQGHIIIVNPNGIVFGPSALVQANKFTASALDIDNADFMSGNLKFAGDGIGEIANYGEMTAEQVALIGRKVYNAGTITGDYVLMAAGDSVFLGSEGSDVVVEIAGVTAGPEGAVEGIGDVINEGTITSDGGKIILAAGDTFSRAIEGIDGLSVATDGGTGRVGQFGTISADSTDGDGGDINLTAADAVVLGSESITTANAGANGDGGQVVVYSPGNALFREGAVVEAKGGEESGNGGFFELSGKEYVEVLGDIDLKAANGDDGEFLIDPRNIKIVDGTSSEGRLINDKWSPSWEWGYSELGIERLESYLASSDVTISTDGFTFWTQSGWVEFDASRDVYTAAGNDNSLTVRADNRITLNSGIDFDGGGNVTLIAKNDITTNAEINMNGGHLEMLGGQAYGASDININENITAGSMRIKSGKDYKPGEQSYSGVYIAEDKALEATTGGITVEAVHDIVLGGAVTAAGDVYLNADEDGYADNPRPYGGGDLIAKSITAGGNVELMANSMQLNGDVSANGGDLTITGRTSADSAGETLIGEEGAWGNINVAEDMTSEDATLYASGNISISDASTPGETPAMGLTGEELLIIEAGGMITTTDTVISVTGSKLTMHQGDSIDTADYDFANQNNTELTLISDNGSVTSDLTKAANAADQWLTIGATAEGDITLAGERNIRLDNSGTADKSLYSKNGNISVIGQPRSSTVTATKDIVADNGNIAIASTHAIDLDGDVTATMGSVELNSDSDLWRGDDVIVDGAVTAGTTINIEGEDVHLKSTVTAGGDIDVVAHGNYNTGTRVDSSYTEGGDVTIDGLVSTTENSDGAIDIAAARHITLNNTPASADADGTLTLIANTEDVDGNLYAAGSLEGNMTLSGYDVTVDGTVDSHGTLDVDAINTIRLRSDVSSDGVMDMNAGNDIALNTSSGDTTSEDAMTLLAGDKITIGMGGLSNEGNVTADGNMNITAGSSPTSDVVAFGKLETTTGSGGDITVKAGDDIVVYHTNGVSVVADGKLTMTANTSGNGDGVEGGSLFVEGSIEGNMDLSGSNVTVNGTVDSTNTLDVTAVDNIALNSNVSSVGNMTMVAGDNITLNANSGNTSSQSSISLVAGDDITVGKYGDNAGNVTANGNMAINAGTGSRDDVKVYGKLTTTGGNIDVTAGNDITVYGTDSIDDPSLYESIEADGTLTVAAGDYLTVKGDISSEGAMTMTAGDNIKLNETAGNTTSGSTIALNAGDDITVGRYGDNAGNVTANGDMAINAGTGSRDDVKVYGKLTTIGGNVDVTAGNNITVYGTDSSDDPSVYESVEADGTLSMLAGGNLYAAGSLEGNMTLSGDNVTIDGDVTSHGTLDVDADDDITLKSNVSSVDVMTMDAGKDIRLNQNGGQTTSDSTIALVAGRDVKVQGNLTTTGNTATGDVLVEAGRDIKFGGDVNVDGHLRADSGLADDSWWLIFYNSGAGSIEASGDVIAASMQLEAGAGSPGYSDSHVSVDGLLQTTTGDMIVNAHHDVLLGGDVDSAANMLINADRHENGYTSGGDIEIDGVVTAVGNIDMYGNNITLNDNVTATGDMTLMADTSSDFKDELPQGDVLALGDLTSIGGSISVYSSDDTTYLGGDVTALNNVLLNNNTEFIGTNDQHVIALTGNVTANGELYKGSGEVGSGSLYLVAAENISLAGDVAVEAGGISIIAQNGKIFTPDGSNDTLNVAITGSSDDALGIGVNLPKNYDEAVEGTGKAAIVIMSEQDLKLGSDADLTAGGVYDTTGAVDDRPGVDFLNVVEGPKDPGSAMDVAIYLASNSGNVAVDSTVNPIPTGGVMVIDAYDTVEMFGDNFIASLEAGNVGWLEVCSRITPTLAHAQFYDTLPFADDLGLYPGLGKYVLRGESPDDGTGAWVLASTGEVPFGEAVALSSEAQSIGSDGCPALVAAVSEELGISADTIEVAISNSIAMNTDIQPCDTCARLIDAAAVLRDEDGARMAAMNQIFNQLAPADSPFTPEMETLVATAFADNVNTEEGASYAAAMEYVDAFVEYVAVLDSGLGSPVDNSLAFVMDKYGAALTEADNANIAAYVASRLEAQAPADIESGDLQ